MKIWLVILSVTLLPQIALSKKAKPLILIQYSAELPADCEIIGTSKYKSGKKKGQWQYQSITHQLRTGSDTLQFTSTSQWYKEGSTLLEIGSPEMYEWRCGSYRGPGFCKPEYPSLPHMKYSSKDTSLIHDTLAKLNVADYELTTVLLNEREALLQTIAWAKKEQEFHTSAFQSLIAITNTYEQGLLKPKGISMKIDFEEYKLSIGFQHIETLRDNSFYCHTLYLSGEINDAATFEKIHNLIKSIKLVSRS